MHIHDLARLARLVVLEEPEHELLADLVLWRVWTSAVVERLPVPNGRPHLLLRIDKPLLEVHFFELLPRLPVLETVPVIPELLGSHIVYVGQFR